MHNKRGLSAVVTTLIIVLLVLVAAGVFYTVFIKFIRSGAEEISLGKFMINLEIENAYVQDNSVKVGVKRNPGKGDLIAINFVISDGANSEVIRKNTNIEELGTERFTLTLNELNIDDVKEVSIAPIYKSSSGEETKGDVMDTHKIGKGSEDGDGGDGGDGGECEPEDPSATCGEWECGTRQNNCGEDVDCGALAGGDCATQYGEGWVCSNGTCVDYSTCEDTCASLGYDCGTWPICGVDTICGDYEGGCAPGYECLEGVCAEITFINSGTIENVWPPESGIYFDSSELPKQDGLYYGKAAYFPDKEPQNCYLIVDYTYNEEIYSNAIVKLNLFEPLNIATGDSYQIWDSLSDCENSITS